MRGHQVVKLAEGERWVRVNIVVHWREGADITSADGIHPLTDLGGGRSEER